MLATTSPNTTRATLAPRNSIRSDHAPRKVNILPAWYFKIRVTLMLLTLAAVIYARIKLI